MRTTRFYKAAFVDVGGTLLHPAESIGTTYSKFLAQFDIDSNPGIIDGNFSHIFNKLKLEARSTGTTAYGTSKDSAKIFWRSVFQQCIPPTELSADTREQIFEGVYSHYGTKEAWALFPESIPFLEELRRRRVPTFIVSNWDARLPELLEKTGIMDWVDGCIGSYFMNSEKPDSRIFQHALKALPDGLNPIDVLHIGDNPDEDGIGAKGCGIAFAHIERKNKLIDESQVSSLLDLLVHFPRP